MYYDRALHPDFLHTLSASATFAALRERTHGAWGQPNLAHLDLRNSRTGPARGSVKLYTGGTAVLELLGHGSGRIKLRAHATYTAGEDFPTRALRPAELDERIPWLLGYLDRAATRIQPHYLAGEYRAHAGLVRRYSSEVGPVLPVDKETKVGFDTRRDTQAFASELKARFGKVHRELDLLGVLADGRIALIELKKESEPLRVAAVQVATHVHTFRRLARQHGATALPRVVDAVVAQKRTLGLLPPAPTRSARTVVVPVIAAPDQRADWQTRWRSAVHATRLHHRDLLDGLQLWRLSDDGHILDVVSP